MRSGFLGRCERSAGSGPLLQCERRSGLSRLSGAVPHVRDQPCVQRFLADGDLRSLGGCSAVTHSAGLTLQRPLSMAKIINTDAGRLPLLAQHPADPEILISQGPIPRRPARLPKEVRSSESTRATSSDWRAPSTGRTAFACPRVRPANGRRHPWNRLCPRPSFLEPSLDEPRSARGPRHRCSSVRR